MTTEEKEFQQLVGRAQTIISLLEESEPVSRALAREAARVMNALLDLVAGQGEGRRSKP